MNFHLTIFSSVVVGLNPSLYPPLDKIPSTDSPEVQQWIQEVANTGVVIPDDPPNNPGSCRTIFRMMVV